MYGTVDNERNSIEHPKGSSRSGPGYCSAPIVIEDTSLTDSNTHNAVRSRSGAGRDGLAGAKSCVVEDVLDFENSCIIIPENYIEAHRIENNYKFGLKKWKSHVTSRPLGTRSEIVQDLYSDMNKIKDVEVSTLRPSNILYTLVFGWWLCLLYCVIGLVMMVSIIGIPYAKFCWKLAKYFFWPFGKFVHQIKPYKAQYTSHHKLSISQTPEGNGSAFFPESTVSSEGVSLMSSMSTTSTTSCDDDNRCCQFWGRPSSWIWVIVGLPPLLIVHSAVFIVCWFLVISIPTAKLNGKTITKILFLPPNEMKIGDSGVNYKDKNSQHSEIIMYSHQSINFYYYKYTVDGVNIILANFLIFVILSIVIGYSMDISGIVKCIMGTLAIVPLTYYIGMAITSISAQSNFAVGAFLNATFGSAVEVILFVIMLNKGRQSGEECYQELVKSSLTGAILCSILFIPGMSMVIGGLKFRTQKFNPKSANISASFLFLAVVGVFAPTIFSKIYGSLKCEGCESITEQAELGIINFQTNSSGFLCQQCEQSLTGFHGDRSVYHNHIKPLVYSISIIFPIAYIIGIIFTMKTHSAHLFAEFEQELKEENGKNMIGQHGTAQWSRSKSAFILFVCAISIALCGELISENIQPLLEATGISEYFVGVTMLSLVAELPEVVNGVQFALQNNVNLGIEIGCSTAIQVCLVQIPILVLANLIYDMDFILVFNDIHLWSVIFSVVIINYIFQDGKSDYFQGSIVVAIYILLMLMYFFMLTPPRVMCKLQGVTPITTTIPTTITTTLLPT